MTDPATGKLAKPPMSQLPARKHRWNHDQTKYLASTEFRDGNARTFRPCILCQVVKITVHGSDGTSFWREWRTRDGEVWVGEAMPPCLEVVKA